MEHTLYPHISIVVIGRNEGERLVRCLQSVHDAEYPSDKIELIYVDSNSSDDSCLHAEQLGATVIRINPTKPTAAHGRNAGWQAAQHDWVHFFDGDTIINKHWLNQAVTAITEDSAIACVFGRREELYQEASIYNFWSHHDWYSPPGYVNSCGGDALFRRAALLAAEGYDEGLIAGEEPDLCYRIRSEQGLKILSLDLPMTLHDMAMSKFSQYWKRCVRTGHAHAEVGLRYKGMDHWRRNCVRNCFYALGTPLAILLSVITWSFWPLGLWVLLILVAWLRNALRLKARAGTMSAALKISAHHYLAKIPTAVGHFIYWLRLLLKRGPQRLIEYRS